MRIDLHSHSTASDGTETPAVLVRSAVAAGLDVLALTDHDSVAGWDEAAAALAGLAGGGPAGGEPVGVRPGGDQPAGDQSCLTLVRGVELSCQHGGTSLHLLGLLVDPADAGLAGAVATVRQDRVPRARAMVERLAADGWPLSWASVLEQAGTATIGRPHIADALVAAGAVADRAEAFAGVLASTSPYYVRNAALDAVDAVRLVVGAGGVAVLAHPRAGRRGRTLSDSAVTELAAAGLAAVEVEHRDHDADERAHLRALASRLGLLSTGASDYHGAGKPNRLGENLTEPRTYHALLARAGGAVRPLTPAAARELVSS